MAKIRIRRRLPKRTRVTVQLDIPSALQEAGKGYKLVCVLVPGGDASPEKLAITGQVLHRGSWVELPVDPVRPPPPPPPVIELLTKLLEHIKDSIQEAHPHAALVLNADVAGIGTQSVEHHFNAGEFDMPSVTVISKPSLR